MPNPLSSQGYDIDPVTREPLQVKAEEAMHKASSERMSLANDISGEGGALIKEIANLYIARIEKIISIDPECMAYENIFRAVDFKLNAGERIVSKRFKMHKV